MLSFTCPVCGQLLFFENSVCLRCSTPLGFTPESMDLRPLTADDRRCANAELAGCNWLLAPGDAQSLCRSCRLTRTRPHDSDTAGLAAFLRAEQAKRRLLFELLDLGLPVGETQPTFDLLSSAAGPVSTGHADGVVTLDLAEAEDDRRERRRVELDEPYRTLLGHFRHEIGHYYWPILVQAAGEDTLAAYRALFGDERADYAQSLQRHYEQGPPADWVHTYVSAYAAMHSWEDWAETFAHYLHIRDALQTGAAYGPGPGPEPELGARADPALIAVPALEPERETIEEMVAAWLPYTYALNAVNRSMTVVGLVHPMPGRMSFSPAPGFDHRTVIAQFELAGLPAESVKVASFTPVSPRLARVSGLKLVRHGLAVRVSWSAVRGATEYELVARLSSSGERLVRTRRHSISLVRVASYDGGVISVLALATLRQGRPVSRRLSPAARAPTRLGRLPRLPRR